MYYWTEAAAAANSLITGGTYPLLTGATAFKNLWITDGGMKTIFQFAASQPSELSNANNIYLGQHRQCKIYT